MLSFLVFDGERPATERVLRHACLLGPEGMPLPGEIGFERGPAAGSGPGAAGKGDSGPGTGTGGGLIRCQKASGEAAALSLQVMLDESAEREVGGADAFRSFLSGGKSGDDEFPEPPGVITLQTCLLPERSRPYLLSLELARHRIMLFLTKLEEWQLFTLGADELVMRRFEAARRAFTAALVARRPVARAGSGGRAAEEGWHGFTAEANRLATRALWLSVDAGERLALIDAERRLPERVSGALYRRVASQNSATAQAAQGPNPPALLTPDLPGPVLPHRPMIGVTVSPASFGEGARDVAGKLDFVSVPVRWREMEPTEGRYSYKGTDQWIEWAIRKARLPVAAGPLIDFRPSCVPEWLYIWENDYETLRDLVEAHLKTMVTRYRRTVSRWTVLSGIHSNENFRFSFDQMMDLSRLCVQVVRKLHPAGKVLIEVTQPWGEYYTASRRSLIPVQYAEMVLQAGVPVDGFGMRLLMGGSASGQSSRDLMELSALLDRYAALERPLTVTAIGVPSAAGGDDGAGAASRSAADPFESGSWHGGWSEQTQARWLTAACSVACAKPWVQAVCWHELMDAEAKSEIVSGGVLTRDGRRKRSAERLIALREALAAGRPPTGLYADAPVPGSAPLG